jgi:hypothetical protein
MPDVVLYAYMHTLTQTAQARSGQRSLELHTAALLCTGLRALRHSSSAAAAAEHCCC